MFDPPSPADMIAQVRAAMAKDISDNFAQKVAANAMSIAERQIASADAADAAEMQRLGELLDGQGELEEMNRKLCEAIRNGDIAMGDAQLETHLIATTLQKIAVDQPGYAAYRRYLEDIGRA